MTRIPARIRYPMPDGTYVKGPTVANLIREHFDQRGGLPDPAIFQTWRYRWLARPLLRLADRCLTSSEKNAAAAYMHAGWMVFESPADRVVDPGEVLTENAVLREKCERLAEERGVLLNRATTAENGVRGLRGLLSLVGEDGRATR